MRRTIFIVLCAAAALTAGYAYREPLKIFALQTYQKIAPCTVPITYSIGNIDERFGISRERVIEDTKSASTIWNKAAGKELFRSVESGGALRIDLVYDERQATTMQLQSLGLSVTNDAESYDAVKARYDSFLKAFNAEKASYTSNQAVFEKAVADYEEEVRAVNARGGAAPEEHARLETQKQRLLAEQSRLQKLQERVNADADTVNALVRTLNRLARELNQSAAEYNKAGSALGEEFEEAVFESRPGSQHISVYEFDSNTRLIRVLTHEFGHALGLEHVDDSTAIMYRLNQSTNLTPSKADIAEVYAACRMSEGS